MPKAKKVTSQKVRVLMAGFPPSRE